MYFCLILYSKLPSKHNDLEQTSHKRGQLNNSMEYQKEQCCIICSHLRFLEKCHFALKVYDMPSMDLRVFPNLNLYKLCYRMQPNCRYRSSSVNSATSGGVSRMMQMVIFSHFLDTNHNSAQSSWFHNTCTCIRGWLFSLLQYQKKSIYGWTRTHTRSLGHGRYLDHQTDC